MNQVVGATLVRGSDWIGIGMECEWIWTNRVLARPATRLDWIGLEFGLGRANLECIFGFRSQSKSGSNAAPECC